MLGAALSSVVVIAAGAQAGLDASIDPASGPTGSTFTISGTAPDGCGTAVVHRAPPEIGQGQAPIVGGAFSVTFGVPGQLGPGDIAVEVSCLEAPEFATTVVFTVTAGQAGDGAELAETGAAATILALVGIGLILIGASLTLTRRRSRRSASNG